MKKIKIITQKEVSKLIDSASFLSEEEKREWFVLVESLDHNQIQEIYEHFKTKIENQKKFKLIMIVKHKLFTKFQSAIKQITEKFIKKSLKKQEKAENKEDTSADILLDLIE